MDSEIKICVYSEPLLELEEFRLFRANEQKGFDGYAKPDGSFTSGRDMFDKQELAEAAQFEFARDAIAWAEARGWTIIGGYVGDKWTVSREEMLKGDEKVQQRKEKLLRKEMGLPDEMSVIGRGVRILAGFTFVIFGAFTTIVFLGNMSGTFSMQVVACFTVLPIAAGVGLLWHGITRHKMESKQLTILLIILGLILGILAAASGWRMVTK